MPPRNKVEVTVKPDMINHPPHYAGDNSSIECIDAIEAMLGREGFIAFLRGQVLKYTWRMGRKGCPVEDIEKAGWYRNKLEETLNEGP